MFYFIIIIYDNSNSEYLNIQEYFKTKIGSSGPY